MRSGMQPDQLCEKQATYAATRKVVRDVTVAAYLKAKAMDSERADPE
jgi:hypothetical protein